MAMNLSTELRQILPELHERLLGRAYRANTFAGDPEVLLGAAAALGRRLAELRGGQAAFDQAIERRVDTGQRHGPPRRLLDVTRDRDAVRVVAETHQDQQD